MYKNTLLETGTKYTHAVRRAMNSREISKNRRDERSEGAAPERSHQESHLGSFLLPPDATVTTRPTCAGFAIGPPPDG